MASLCPESIQRLLKQTNLKVDRDSVNEDLNCTVCGRLMIDAHQTLCDCRYCRECLAKSLEDGNKYCLGGKKDCLKEDLVIGENVLPSAVLTMKILKARVHCPNEGCEETHVLTGLENHLRVCSRQQLQCPYSAVGCSNGGGYREEMEAHLTKESLAHSWLMVGIIDNLRNEVGVLREELQISKLEAAASKEETDAVKAQQDQMTTLLEERIARLEGEIREGGQTVASSALDQTSSQVPLVGEYKFKVTKMNERMAKEGKAIYSPYIYSHPEGYKLRLRVDPARRFGTLRRRQVAVSSVVCKGEYDDVLSWPCQLAISASILKQPSDESPSPLVCNYKQSCNKPTNVDNLPSEWTPLVTHEDLRQIVGLVEDDSILIHAVIKLAADGSNPDFH